MEEEEEFEPQLKVDLAPFMAAAIFEAGGELNINYSTIVELNKDDVYISMDMNDAGTILTLRLRDEREVPEDARG